MKHLQITLVILGTVILTTGCHAVKGAQEGFKQDWKDWQQSEGWVEENLW